MILEIDSFILKEISSSYRYDVNRFKPCRHYIGWTVIYCSKGNQTFTIYYTQISLSFPIIIWYDKYIILAISILLTVVAFKNLSILEARPINPHINSLCCAKYLNQYAF